MNVLVMGGAGFVGSHIVDGLLARGCTVRVFDRLQDPAEGSGSGGRWKGSVETQEGDPRDASAVKRALEQIQAVFYCASQRTGTLMELIEGNVAGVATLYKAASESRSTVEKVVIASTRAVYGEGQHYCEEHGLFLPPPRPAAQLERGDWDVHCEQCQAVTSPVLLREGRPNPASAYAISKLAQEVTALGLGKGSGIPTVILRYSTVVGPRLPFSPAEFSIAALFGSAAREGMSFPVFEDGLQLRDYIHVADVVEASLWVLQDKRSDGQVYNVGNGRAVSVVELARVLSQAAGSQSIAQVCGIYRLGDARHSVACTGKIEALGWRPFKSLRETMDDYIGWLGSARSHGVNAPQALETAIRKGRIRGARARQFSTAAG